MKDRSVLPHRSWLSFWILALLAVAITAITASAMQTDSVAQLQLAIRATARISAVLFLAAFAASSLAALWPRPWSFWMVTNRRQIGLAFAFSHAVHAICIYAYVSIAPEAFWQGRSVAGNVPGTIGYLAILVLVLTSSDGAMKRLGHRRWKRMHIIAMWVVFAVFLLALAKRVPMALAYAIPAAAFIAAAALRLVAGLRRFRDEEPPFHRNELSIP